MREKHITKINKATDKTDLIRCRSYFWLKIIENFITPLGEFGAMFNKKDVIILIDIVQNKIFMMFFNVFKLFKLISFPWYSSF